MSNNNQTTIQKQRQSVAKPPKRVDVLKSVLNADSVKEQFQNALGKNANVFMASIIDLYSSNSGLQNCDPNKIVREALKAAVLQLPINKALGFSYIVAYNNSKRDENGNWIKVIEPNFQLGYKGYIQLAMRTGQYKTINAGEVYEGEFRMVNKLTGEVDFNGTKKSDKVVGYFCYFELLNGFSKSLYMTVEQMATHAKKFSKGIGRDVSVEQLIEIASLPTQANSSQVGWQGNFHGMAIKTVIRLLLSKYGYLSIEMQSAIVDDQEGDSYEIQDGEIQRGQGIKDFETDDVEFQEVSAAPEASPGY